MKKWIAICMLTVLVIGVVFMGGCTDTESTKIGYEAPTTAVPTTKVTVVKTTAVPTTTVTKVPTTAVPTTTATVKKTTAVPTTTATVKKTTAVPVTTVAGIGSLVIVTNGGLGGEVTAYVARAGTGFDLYGNSAAYTSVTIFPDGTSGSVSLEPGQYTAYLPDKLGTQQPEQQSFTINPNCNTVVQFSGYSYRAASGGGCGGG
jgi:hypothetical protein